MNFLRRCSLLTLALVSSAVLVGCNFGGSDPWAVPPPPPPPPVVAPTVVSIAITTPAGGALSLSIGASSSLAVTATYSDNTTKADTGVTYALSAVSPAGAVTLSGAQVSGGAVGTASIVATDTATGKTSAPLSVTVNPTVLTAIAVTPSPVTLATAGATQALTVTATYSNASTAVLTSGVTFASDNTGVATVGNTDGMVTAVANGSAHVTATDTASGKTGSTTVNVGPPVTGGLVFFNDYDTGVTFRPFDAGSAPVMAVDSTNQMNGRNSLKIVVPGLPPLAGRSNFVGGALVASAPRTLSSYNALTFWAKSSAPLSTFKVGLGDNARTVPAPFKAEVIAFSFTTTWTKYVIPLPDPSKLVGSDGLFYFADGLNNYTIWLNDIQYETLPANLVGPVTNVTSGWGPKSVAIGATAQINPAPNSIFFPPAVLPNGTLLAPRNFLNDDSFRWFTLTSSNPAVATVNVDGTVTGVAVGTATITGTMRGFAVPGSSLITVTAPLATPTNNAAPPAIPASHVIALFNSTGTTIYTPVLVDTFNTGWCPGVIFVPAYAIPGGNPVIKYDMPNCDGIAFGDGSAASGGSTAHQINASAAGMTRFHVDLWSPNPVPLEIQIIDNASAGGGAITGKYNAGTIAANTWVSIDVPFSSFVGLSAQDKLQQIGFFTNNLGITLYIDNLYFWY